MGTKNKPGQFDCYANAEPDEPMFVLLGRDPDAAIAVLLWRAIKMAKVDAGTSKSSPEKLAEAMTCAKAMAEWARAKGKDQEASIDALRKVLDLGTIPLDFIRKTLGIE